MSLYLERIKMFLVLDLGWKILGYLQAFNKSTYKGLSIDGFRRKTSVRYEQMTHWEEVLPTNGYHKDRLIVQRENLERIEKVCGENVTKGKILFSTWLFHETVQKSFAEQEEKAVHWLVAIQTAV